MSKCINKSHPEFKQLLLDTDINPFILAAKVGIWMEQNNTEDFPTIEQLNILKGKDTPRIAAHLKIIDVLPTLQRNVFSKDKIQGWLNDLQKKGVSAAQLEMFREVAKPGMTKDDIIVAIAAKNSFAVEVNIALGKGTYDPTNIDNFDPETLAANVEKDKETPTQHYSYLTVPGGTNYTENEIATPEITPNIKGHADFSTDKGIGWFRSDKKVVNEYGKEEELTGMLNAAGLPLDVEKDLQKELNDLRNSRIDTKTRRILEFQSDLFQKGRDRKDLIGTGRKTTEISEEEFNLAKKNGKEIIDKDPIAASNYYIYNNKEYHEGLLPTEPDFYTVERPELSKENQFLQLLNKKNNWVNFFIKSIIQDSARKGYEKVLFPTGETAAKVEGHQTIADELVNINDTIKELQLKKITEKDVNLKDYNTKQNKAEQAKKGILSSHYYQNTTLNGKLKTPVIVFGINTKNTQNEVGMWQTDKKSKEYNTIKDYIVKEDENIHGVKFWILNNEFKKEALDSIIDANDINKEQYIKDEIVRLEKDRILNIQELETKKQEMKTQGLEKIKPIEAFYKNRVTNVLKKQGYNPKRITDEHGNTWNEVTIEKERDEAPILYQVGPSNGRAVIKQARDIYFDEVYQKELSDNDIIRINSKLRKISDSIGDQPWRLRKSHQGNYYIAGYKNANVAAKEDTYYSPYANGMFRQLNSKNTEKANAKLDRLLAAWARKHGVAVESLKSVMKKFPNRFEQNAIGVADFMNSLIALADGRNIDTFAEEVAHFAIEMQLMSEGEAHYILGPPTIKRALEQVTETETYAEVKEEYKDIYENEEDFRKEALGKILAAEIVNQFKQTDEFVKEEVSGFWQSLKQVWRDFTAWLDWALGLETAGRTDIEQVIIPLARDILNLERVGDYNKFEDYKQLKKYKGERPFTDVDIKYQKEKKEDKKKLNKKEQFLKKVEAQLLKKLNTLKKYQKDTRSEKDKKAILLLDQEITRLQKDIINQKYNTGISRWIYNAKEEVYEIFKILDAAEKGEVTLSHQAANNYKIFLDSYNSLINTLIEDVRVSTVTREEGNDIEKAISELRDLISKSRTRLKPITLEKSKEEIRSVNRTPDGEVIDEEFDEDAAFESSQTGFFEWFKYWTGNFKNAKSPIIRAVHKLIYNAYGTVKRFAVKTARDVLNSQTLFATKYKQEELLEHVDGKHTHYLLSEHHYSKYFKNREEYRKTVAKALGYIDPETGEGDPSLVNKNYFTEEQAAIYTKMWEKWYAQNAISVKVNAVKDYIDDNGNLRTKTLMQLKNSNRDPIWVDQSEVDAKKKQGYFIKKEYKQVPNNTYKNKDFEKKMKDETFRLHYNTIMRVKREAIAKLYAGLRTDQLLYMAPAVMKSTLDRIFKADGNIFTRIKEVAREGVMIEQDDTQFGELRELDKEAVPIFFTKELKDVSKLSTDIGRSIVMFAEMAENYFQMTKIAPATNNILNSLKEKEYYKTRRGGIKESVASEATMEFATVKEMIDSLVYGQQRQTAEWTIPGTNKTFSFTKLTALIAKYIRNNNLAFNVPTSLAGYIKGSIDSVIEGSTGLYITAESKNWSRAEFMKEIGIVIGQIGSIKQTSKMHLINQDVGVVSLDSMLFETDKSRLTRKLASGDLMYVTYATGDYGLKSRITLSVYDNYRLYDGAYITKEQFLRKTAAKKGIEYGKSRKADKAHEKSVQKEWAALREKSLYNAYESVDGKLKIKKGFKQYINEGLLNAVRGKIEYVSNNIDGILGATDKGKLARTSAGDFLLMHRGWFINLIDAKFQSQKISWITGEEEIGHYKAFFGQYIPAVFKGMKGGDFMAARSVYDQMSKAQRRGVKKSALDALAMLIVSFLAGLANVAADEDDDDLFITQFTALILNRVLMEQSAPWSPATLTDLIDEPVVGTKMLKGWTDLRDLFSGEAIESGPYEGQSRRSKWLQKKIPFGWKNIYELQYPEEKNKFYKNLVGDGFFYNALSNDPEKQYSLIKWLKQSLGPAPVRDWDNYTEQEQSDILLEGIETLEQEEDSYNGWN